MTSQEISTRQPQSPMRTASRSIPAPDPTTLAEQSPLIYSIQKLRWIGAQISLYTTLYTTQLIAFLRELPQRHSRALISVVLILGVIVALKILFALIGALNDLPLIPALLKLIGLAYSIWFASHYLFTESGRQDLSQKLQSFKDKGEHQIEA
jgi:hypothetical protein